MTVSSGLLDSVGGAQCNDATGQSIFFRNSRTLRSYNNKSITVIYSMHSVSHRNALKVGMYDCSFEA